MDRGEATGRQRKKMHSSITQMFKFWLLSLRAVQPEGAFKELCLLDSELRLWHPSCELVQGSKELTHL